MFDELLTYVTAAPFLVAGFVWLVKRFLQFKTEHVRIPLGARGRYFLISKRKFFYAMRRALGWQELVAMARPERYFKHLAIYDDQEKKAQPYNKRIHSRSKKDIKKRLKEMAK